MSSQTAARSTTSQNSQAASQALDLAEHYLDISKPQQARKVLGEASLEPDPYRFLYLSGRTHYQLRAYNDAKEATLAALEYQPNDLQASYLLIQCQRQLKNYDEALELLKTLRQQHPERPDLAELMGFVMLSRGDYGAMTTALAEAKKLRAGRPNSSLEASVALMYGKFDAALEHSLNALRDAPDDPHNHHLVAQAEQKMWQLDSALEHARVAAALAPTVKLYRSHVHELEIMTHPLYRPLARLMAWNFKHKSWPLIVCFPVGLVMAVAGMLLEQLWLALLGFAIAVGPSAIIGVAVVLIALGLNIYFYYRRRRI